MIISHRRRAPQALIRLVHVQTKPTNCVLAAQAIKSGTIFPAVSPTVVEASARKPTQAFGTNGGERTGRSVGGYLEVLMVVGSGVC